MPDGHVIHRSSLASPPLAVDGRGCYLIDAEGRRYLDASGGAAVSCLGHGHPAVIEAIQSQAAKLAYAHTSFFSNEPMEALATFLAERAPGDLDQVYFVSGGSEGMEAVLKIARQFFVETGQPGRTRFVARRQSYHGNTLGALAVGGNEGRRLMYGPLLMDVHRVAACYEYRERRAHESAEDYAVRLASEFEEKLLEVGPETVIGFVAETVVGATAGALPAVPGYFRRIREVCDRYGVLLILDEVMSGMGRTGTLYACVQEGVVPDAIVVAKGLGGGYQPIGAVLVSSRITDAIRAGSGAFQHGHTYIGHPIACAAALAVQRTIEGGGLLAGVGPKGRALREMLDVAFRDHPYVGDIRGRGLLLGVELVEDRTTQAPFDPGRRLHAVVKREAMSRGLLVYPGGGTADGTRGDHVLIAPPYIVEQDDIESIVALLRSAVDAATGFR
jgi:adenosylmethionine-8-amino-7-oxononanoate aminotransferase